MIRKLIKWWYNRRTEKEYKMAVKMASKRLSDYIDNIVYEELLARQAKQGD